jgi:tetratricopeptide (TPR) repeat protein
LDLGPYDKAEENARNAYELYEEGQMAQALSELNRALEINPTNSAWHFNKGLTLDAINRFEEAIAEYEIALDLSPNDLEILNSLAVDYTRAGFYDRALATFEYIERLDSNFEPCYCNRIITYTEMGQHDLAEQMFYLAQQIEPDCALCYYNIGNSLFARHEYKKAIRCWLRTAELESTHPQINYRIAQAYWSDGEHERAREHFLAELRVNPGDVDVIMDFALLMLERGDMESAKEKFNRILELDPDYAPALFYLGELAYDCGDATRAMALFEESLERDPTLPGPHYRMAQHALSVKRPHEARAHLITELDLDVEDADTLVSMGSMLLTAGDPDHAVHCFLRATGYNKRSSEAYYYLGVTTANKGHFEDAVRFFRRALELDADHAGALRDLAYTYLAAGRLDEASDQIARAKATLPNILDLRVLGHGVRLLRLLNRITTWIDRLRRPGSSRPAR